MQILKRFKAKNKQKDRKLQREYYNIKTSYIFLKYYASN